MSLWSSYRNLSSRTRLFFGLGLMAWAGIGLRTSPQVEDTLGMVPTQQEQDELDRKLSLRISRVDKEVNHDRP
ncbi:hypothetical protein V8E54_000063 [Elaphomyces granulatus]